MSPTFNTGQREAVESRAERVVVSAGAGSGKTRVLVQRFVDRVLEQEAAGVASPIRSVLLITFTDKAAGELTERVRRAFLEAGRADLARDVDSAWISTIHGFCARIVRRHALELGIDAQFAVLADPHTGLERVAAFERAARASLTSSTHAGTLTEMADEGVADLRITVLSAYDRARSKGVSVRDVGVAAPTDLPAALQTLTETLDGLLPEYRALRATATVEGNLAGFELLREEAAAAAAASSGAQAARAVLVLAGRCGACRGDEETKALTRAINEAVQAVVQAAADALATERAVAWRELLVAFAEEYEGAKAARGALDFEDLQLLTRRLWTERPDIAERLGDRFVEIMVDEFQDTNPLQLQVITPISRGGQCVVGDVQQSIYRFRDADVGLLDGKRRLAESNEAQQACRLNVNYRSDRGLLDGLNRIFGGPDFFGDDYLTLEGGADRETTVRWPEGEPRIEAIVVDKERCPDEPWRAVEARAVAGRLRAIADAGRASADDIVVLVRASTTMPVYVEALREAGFDVIAASAGGFYATPEYADVRAMLNVLVNPLDDEGVLALLAGGLGGLTDDALLLLSLSGRGRGLWRALSDAGDAGLAGHDLERARLVCSTIAEVRDLRGRLSLADTILHVASKLGPGGGLFEGAAAWPNVRKAVRFAAEFERDGGSDPASLLRYLENREAFVPREPAGGLAVEGSGAVRVMTVHAAKGLEFPVVVVADLGHGPVNKHPSFLLAQRGDELVAVARGAVTAGGAKVPAATPWVEAVDEEKRLDLAESRRVFYVACTRAEQVLVLAGSTEPEKPAHDGIAADWVLAASRRVDAPLEGLMSLTVIGSDGAALASTPHDVTPVMEDEPGTLLAAGTPAPRLPAPGAIPPPQEVSYTALALFERCAYRFFAERMLRVGSLELPAPEDPRAFGSALHAALELIARGGTVDAEVLRHIAAGHHLPQDGSPERLAAAVAAVRASDAGPMLALGSPEVPFAIRVADGVVRGTMDLVVRDGDVATVLDYKTGLTWDASGHRYLAQAEIYALALLVAGATSVVVRFVHVEAGCEVVEHGFTASDRARIVSRVEAAFRRMQDHVFPPLTAYDPGLCADCPVSGSLCRVVHPHAGKRGR